MILAEVRDYLVTHRRAAIGDLVARFGVDETALRGMLEMWERKGKIHRVGGAACGSCCGCADGRLEAWEWIG